MCICYAAYYIQPRALKNPQSTKVAIYSICNQIIQDLGAEKGLFEVLAKSVSYETRPDRLWPCNLIHGPVCQLAEHEFKKCSLMTTLQHCSRFVTQFSVKFVFCCFLGAFWQSGCFKNVTPWSGVTRGSRVSLGCLAHLRLFCSF